MTKTKSTKRALLMSVLSMFLCVVMLAGTTFAWFTDSVTSTNNIIKSGNLNVEMYYADGKLAVPADDSTDWKNANGVAIYTADQLWEPGYTDAKHIKISNEGNLGLKYQLAIIPTGEVSILADVIDVYLYEIADTDANATQVATRADLNEAMKVGTLKDVISQGIVQGNLNAQADYTTTIVLKMQESAGNDYKDKSIGDSFTIQLLATQLADESDSFDDQYDKDAWVSGMSVYTAEDLQAALNAGENVVLGADIETENGFVIESTNAAATYSLRSAPAATVINLNGHTLTATGDKVTLFQVGDGANEGKDCNESLTIFGGKIVLESTNGVLDGTGVSTGAAIAVDFMSTGTLNIYDTEIVGSRRGGSRALEIGTGKAYLKNVTLDCAYGSGVNAYWGSDVVLDDCNITVKGMYSAPYNSVCFSACYGATVTVNSGNYKLINDNTYNTGNTHGGWVGIVMSSGGTITTNGGTFENVPAAGFNPQYERAIFEAENNAPAVSTLNLLGGTFIPQEDQIYSGYGDQYMPTFNVPNLIDCGDGVWVAAPEGVNNVIIDEDDLVALGGTKINGTYMLMADLDMSGKAMKSMEVSGGATVNFIGNGHTISNLTLGAAGIHGMTGAGSEVAGLFDLTAPATTVSLTVSDLAFENSTVACSGYAAVVVGYNPNGGTTITLENVDVKGATVTSDTVAALVGYTTGVVKLTDCDVSGLALTGAAGRPDKVGAYVGTANGDTCAVTVTNCTNSTAYKCAGRVIYDATMTVDGAYYVTTAGAFTSLMKGSESEVNIILADGKYENVLTASNKKINIVGEKKDGAEIALTNAVSSSHDHLGLTGCTVTLENVKVTFEDGAYYAAYINQPTMTYINCTITGQFYIYGNTSFIGCTFDNDDDAAKTAMRYIYIYDGDVVVDDCDFYTQGHGLIMYSDNGGSGDQTLTVRKSRFHGGAGRTAYAVANQNTAGIEIDGSCGANYTLILEGNNTFDEGFSGLWRIKAMKAGVTTTVDGTAYTGTGADVYLDGTHYTKDGNRNVTKS